MTGVQALKAVAKLQQAIAEAVAEALRVGLSADDAKQVLEKSAELLDQYGEE
jgi:3-hydroxyisobutyrate dehydrogenase-like beta-hydroxyacid dehydrogenase